MTTPLMPVGNVRRAVWEWGNREKLWSERSQVVTFCLRTLLFCCQCQVGKGNYPL